MFVTCKIFQIFICKVIEMCYGLKAVNGKDTHHYGILKKVRTNRWYDKAIVSVH